MEQNYEKKGTDKINETSFFKTSILFSPKLKLDTKTKKLTNN